jgi:hypothetical protein
MAETDWYTIRGEVVRYYIEEKLEAIAEFPDSYFDDEDELDTKVEFYKSLLTNDDYTLGLAWMNSVGETYWNASDNVCEDAMMLMSKPGWENEL